MGCSGSKANDAESATATAMAEPVEPKAITAARPETGATINISYIVPKDKADDVQAVLMKHANFMEQFYANSTEHLISCYFTHAPLFNEPIDPSKGETDLVVFGIHEEFTGDASVARHIETAKENAYFPEFGKVLTDYGKVVSPLGKAFFKIASARVVGDRPETGATINISYIVPKDKADDVQAVLMKHANFMEQFYANSTEHLISCYFTHAPLFNEPIDPSKGETDLVVFGIHEEFTGDASVARHIETAKENAYFPEFGKVLTDYGKVVSPLGKIYFKIR